MDWSHLIAQIISFALSAFSFIGLHISRSSRCWRSGVSKSRRVEQQRKRSKPS